MLQNLCIRSFIAVCLSALAAGVLPEQSVCADDTGRQSGTIVPLGTVIRHEHDPIYVQSKPVIERLPIKVIEPVDLRIADQGHLFVADRKAECVFRMETDGDVSVAIQQLTGIQRIQLDNDNDLFVLTSTGGESSVHQLTRSGRHVILETMSFPASAFALDTDGECTIAVADSGRLMSLTLDGVLRQRCVLPDIIRDVTLNAGGQIEVLLGSGHVVRVSSDDRYEFVGFAPAGSSRLMLRDDGGMLALNSDTPERPGLAQVSRSHERPETFQIDAHVPAGTRAAGFDALGNLCLVNPDLRAVTRVTSRFRIPCPHCSSPTLMILSPDAPQAPEPNPTRRF